MDIEDFLSKWHIDKSTHTTKPINAIRSVHLDKSVIYSDSYHVSDYNSGYIIFELNNIRIGIILLQMITEVD